MFRLRVVCVVGWFAILVLVCYIGKFGWYCLVLWFDC